MLTIYRRHRSPCRHASRRFRNCKCPIWVQGSLRGDYVRRSLDLRSWEAASDLITAWNASGEIGVVKPEAPTIREAVERFLADCEARHLKETSLKKYRVLLEKKLLPFCEQRGWSQMRQLTLDALRQFRESWDFAPITHQKNLEFLKAFLRFAENSEWVRGNPARALKPPKLTPAPTLPFSEEEVKKLIAKCRTFNGNGVRLRAMILLLRYSGLRISDAVALTRDRIAGGRIFLYTQKTGTPVNVPVPKKVNQALAAMPGDKYVFWSGNGKLKSAIEDWRRSFMSLAEFAGVSDASFHRLRDTFAVELLLAGVPIDQVAILLGHSSIKITEKHYAPWVKARQQQLEAAVKKAW